MDTILRHRRIVWLSRRFILGAFAGCLIVALGRSVQAQQGPALPPAGGTAAPASVKKAASHPQEACCAPAPTACCLRPYDQVWLISARSLSCSSSGNGLKYWQLDEAGHWNPSARELFLGTDEPSVPTTVWIHGNRISSGQAASVGITVYRQLVRRGDGQPLRFVIWSWPSDRIKGLFKDVRIKADRANAHGYYLGWLLNQVQPDCRVSLIGYSYGARIATGGLHLLAGGSVYGRKLSRRWYPDREPLRAVLMASAEDSDTLLPGGMHGKALSQVDQLLLVNNPCDWVLRHYRLIARYRPVALGHAGLAVYALPKSIRAKVKQVSICGKKHDWSLYIHSSFVMARTRSSIFWNGKRPPSAVAARTKTSAAAVAAKQ